MVVNWEAMQSSHAGGQWKEGGKGFSTALQSPKSEPATTTRKGIAQIHPLKALSLFLLAVNHPSVRPRNGGLQLFLSAGNRARNYPVLGKAESTLDPIADEVVGFDASFIPTFLEKYWQKKPLLIRQAVREVGVNAPVNGEDLLELSTEDDVESRIVMAPDEVGHGWAYHEGPFEREDLVDILVLEKVNEMKEVPRRGWSVLVQEVDRHVPAVADLWEKYFNFVPTWRRDDIMISYSRKGGGIGAHVDNYDVFLIQSNGKRQWSIENKFLSHSEELKREVRGEAIRLLHGFSQDQSWVLRPGDMLYLPARIPHEGVALADESTTVSMGFVAPSMQSITSAYFTHINEGISENDLLSVADLDSRSAAESPGSVQKDLAVILQKKLQASFISNDSRDFDRWLGEYLTAPQRMHTTGPTPFFLRYKASPDVDDNSYNWDAYKANSQRTLMKFMDGYRYTYGDIDFEIPLSVEHEHFSVASNREFPDAASVIDEVLHGHSSLRLLEGVRVAYTTFHVCFNGRCMILPSPQKTHSWIGPFLCDSRTITPEKLRAGKKKSADLLPMLESLISSGFFYPVDIFE